MAARKTSIPVVYRLRVELSRIAPPIWRRIEVPADITFGQLHDILQRVMGWTDSHMHWFKMGRELIGTPSPEDAMLGTRVKDEEKVRLSAAAKKGSRFIYEYDFGDSWEHLVLVEDVHRADPEIAYPVCLDGKRQCPPEDCGGWYRYENLVEALTDPGHPDHEEQREGYGAHFDPEKFDIETVNDALPYRHKMGGSAG